MAPTAFKISLPCSVVHWGESASPLDLPQFPSLFLPLPIPVKVFEDWGGRREEGKGSCNHFVPPTPPFPPFPPWGALFSPLKCSNFFSAAQVETSRHRELSGFPIKKLFLSLVAAASLQGRFTHIFPRTHLKPENI